MEQTDQGERSLAKKGGALPTGDILAECGTDSYKRWQKLRAEQFPCD